MEALRRFLLILLVTLIALPAAAQARSFTDPGSMEPGEYRYIENGDETYTEYYKGPVGEAIRGDTYSAAEMQESDRLFAQIGIDEGTTGQTGDIVIGADSQNGFASKLLMENYLRTDKPYLTLGEAAVGDEFTAEGVAEGTLPEIATVAGASAGAVIATAASGALVGLYIGEKISELIKWPKLGLFSSTGETPVFPENEKLIEAWTGRTMLGEVESCTVKHYFTQENVELEPSPELCEFPLEEYNTHYEYEESSVLHTGDECGWVGGPEGAGAGRTYGGSRTTCHGGIPEYFNSGNSPHECFGGAATQCRIWVHEPIPEHNSTQYIIWAPLFGDQGVEYGAFPGDESLKAHEKHVERAASGELTHQGRVATPVAPPDLAPSGNPKRAQEIPAPARTKIHEKAKKEDGEPLLPPIEEGLPIPSPTAPEVPEIGQNEPWEQYKEAVEQEGLNPNEHVNPEVDIDPNVGPNDVTGADPAPKTKVEPGTTVDVDVNPDNAPAPVEPPGGGVGGPTLPGFDFPKLGVLCEGFPFGVPCWLAKTIEGWSASAIAPVWGVEMEIKGHKISGSFDLVKLEPIMEKVRPAMLLFATIGLVLLFYNFAKGGGAPSGGGTGDPNPGGPGAEQEFGPKEVDDEGYWKGWN